MKPSRTTFRERLEDMVNALRSEIVTGKLQSGAFLPSITQLSKTFRLSVNSVQKGLDELEAAALIERIPRVGIRVRSASERAVVSISVGYYPNLMQDIDLLRLIEQFHVTFPHIHVKLVPLQYSNYFEIAEYYMREGIVDVIAVNQYNFKQFLDSNEPIAERFEPLMADPGTYPYVSAPYQADGQQWARPIVFSPVILCYNKQHFEKAGVAEPPDDWKWQQFIEQLDRFESGETDAILPFYFYPSTLNRWPIFLLQSGADFTEERVNWASPVIMDSIRTCYDLIHRRQLFSVLLSENDIGVERLFAEQKISVMMTTYFNLNTLRGADFPFDVAPLPYVHVPRTLLLTIGLALNRRSQHKDAARAFIDFIGSYDAQLHIRKHTFSIPALREAAEWTGEELGYRPQRFMMFQELSDTFAQLTDLPLNEENQDRLLSAMNMYWMGIRNIEDTVEQLSEIGTVAALE